MDSPTTNHTNQEDNMNYANHHGYSDVHPYEIIRRVSATTIEIREMEATRIDSSDLGFAPGGFVGHFSRSDEQRYSYSSNTEAPIIRMRLRKGAQWHSIYGRHIISGAPHKFHDFNF